VSFHQNSTCILVSPNRTCLRNVTTVTTLRDYKVVLVTEYGFKQVKNILSHKQGCNNRLHTISTTQLQCHYIKYIKRSYLRLLIGSIRCIYVLSIMQVQFYLFLFHVFKRGPRGLQNYSCGVSCRLSMAHTRAAGED
jgi:hypothetical protein